MSSNLPLFSDPEDKDYPPQEAISVSENCAEGELQAFLNHILEHILSVNLGFLLKFYLCMGFNPVKVTI